MIKITLNETERLKEQDVYCWASFVITTKGTIEVNVTMHESELLAKQSGNGKTHKGLELSCGLPVNYSIDGKILTLGKNEDSENAYEILKRIAQLSVVEQMKEYHDKIKSTAVKKIEVI